MKKTLFRKGSLLISAFLAMCMVACGGQGSQPSQQSQSGQPSQSEQPSKPSSSKPQQSGNLDEGLITNIQDPKTVVATAADKRSTAYAAKTADGTVIGNYKTLSDAINAAVAYDADNGTELDSIVTKVGSDRILFKNRPGYAEGNNDQYWYYENGTSLDAYNCWDGADSVPMLRNTSYITENITSYGEVAAQSWNSYTLLDCYGEQFEDTTYAQYYELSSTMDAALIAFTARRSGITKLHYEVDLTDVKIAPSYDGCDKTYAFIGFYAWQDYYVIANGIACDTSTGNWYQFIGTSRDSSFSDVEYNLGDCVMTSTYNSKGNYFVPDSETLLMDIETKMLHDEKLDEDYQVDYICIEAVGAGKFERYISDSTVNEYFKVYLGIENSYVFIAGLDIKPENELEEPKCVDYFNGSYFTGLTITEAYAYVPTEEELDDYDYGFPINKEWRGKNHDLLLCNTENTEGIIDYNILNTGICCEYMGANDKDIYDFSYTRKNTSSNLLGKNARAYQEVIDSLDSMTKEDLIHDPSTLELVGLWYTDETQIHQKYRNVLDWQPYFDALERLGDIKISEEAKKVIAKMEDLEVKDYKEFGEIYENEFLALKEEEQEIVKISLGKAEFENILSVYDFYKELKGVTDTLELFNDYVYITQYGVSENGKTTYKAEETLDELLEILEEISKGTAWVDDLAFKNDDPNNGAVVKMNGDNNFWPSLRATIIELFYEQHDLELPSYFEMMNTIVDYEDFLDGFYYPIYGTAKIAIRIQNEGLTAINQLTKEELDFLNEVWTRDYVISDQLVYNWESEDADKFETWYSYRTKGVTYLAGGDGLTKTRDYFSKVAQFLRDNGYTVKPNGWGVTVTTIQ